MFACEKLHSTHLEERSQTTNHCNPFFHYRVLKHNKTNELTANAGDFNMPMVFMRSFAQEKKNTQDDVQNKATACHSEARDLNYHTEVK